MVCECLPEQTLPGPSQTCTAPHIKKKHWELNATGLKHVMKTFKTVLMVKLCARLEKHSFEKNPIKLFQTFI